MKALVVDDEPGVLRVLRKTVERLGYSCVLASAAGEALEAFPQGPFELIVTDLLMPGMNGIEFITRARKALPRTAIVVVTSVGGIKMSLEALRRGADEYVVKPFDIRQIDYAVVRAMEKRLSLGTTEKETRRLAEKSRRLRAVELTGGELILTTTAARLLVESAMTQVIERTVHELRNQLDNPRAHLVSHAGPRRSLDEREKVLAQLGHEKTGISSCRAVIGPTAEGSGSRGVGTGTQTSSSLCPSRDPRARLAPSPRAATRSSRRSRRKEKTVDSYPRSRR